jgi:hypothetical protein
MDARPPLADEGQLTSEVSEVLVSPVPVPGGLRADHDPTNGRVGNAAYLVRCYCHKPVSSGGRHEAACNHRASIRFEAYGRRLEACTGVCTPCSSRASAAHLTHASMRFASVRADRGGAYGIRTSLQKGLFLPFQYASGYAPGGRT